MVHVSCVCVFVWIESLAFTAGGQRGARGLVDSVSGSRVCAIRINSAYTTVCMVPLAGATRGVVPASVTTSASSGSLYVRAELCGDD